METTSTPTQAPVEAASNAQPQNVASETKQELIRFTVDGVEEEVTIDELKKRASHASGAAKRMQEAAEMRKQNEAYAEQLQNVFEAIKNDPKAFIALGRKLGVPINDLAIDLAIEQMNLEKMDPTQRELHELKQKHEALQRQYEQEQQAREQQRASEAYQAWQERVGTEYLDFFSKKGITGLEREIALEHVLQYVTDAMDNGRKVTLDQAYDYYERRYGGNSWEARAFEKLKAGTLQIPPEVMAAIRQRDLDAHKKTFTDRSRGPVPPKPKPQGASKPKGQSIDDFFERGYRR